VHGYFTCHDLGTHTLKGLETPIHAYQVLGESAAQSRLEAAEATGLTPLVGRETEVTLLRERWAQSVEGLGQVVEAHTPRPTLRCSPYHTNSALYPVIEHLHRLLHWHREAPPDARLATLEVQTARLPLAEVVPLVAALLSLPVPERYPPLTLSPQRQKQQTLEALVAWLLAEAAQQPMLAIWEDLHWADPSTLELLGLLLDQAPTARLLLVLTVRPEFRPPWGPRSYVMPLTLTRLLRPQVEELVLRLTGGKPLPAEVLRQIVEKTDGIPLFVEELVKTILESGLVREDAERYILTGPLPSLAIPTTLQDALMARLDRLAPVKAVAQLGAVLGREFTYEILRAVAPLDEATLQHGLTQLVAAELLYQRGTPPQATYLFKHALVQDTAYHSLLRSTQQQHHQRIARVIEARFPTLVETQPELVAQHYTAAGCTEQAVVYWQRAGQHASESSAYVEAIAHLTKGLEVLTRLPEAAEQARRELPLQLTLGATLIATKGYTAPEVGQAYARAYALCQHGEQTPHLAEAVYGLWIFSLLRGELQTAQELAEQLLPLPQRPHDPMLLQKQHFALGVVLFFLGKVDSAQAAVERSLTLCEVEQPDSLASHEMMGTKIAGLVYAGWTLWSQGYPDRALARVHDGLALARQMSHPYTLAWTLSYTAVLHQYRREVHAVQEQTEELMALATEQGFAFLVAFGTMLQGWTRAAQGYAAEGMAQLREGLAVHQAMGAELYRPYFLVWLAEACRQGGQVEAGLRVLHEAVAAADKHGQRWWAAEQHRLKGELL
jgi:predicted ATPase